MPGSLLEDPLDSIPIPHPATSTEPTADPPSLTSSLRTATAHVSCRLLLSWQPETQKDTKTESDSESEPEKVIQTQKPETHSVYLANFVLHFQFRGISFRDLRIWGSRDPWIWESGNLGTWAPGDPAWIEPKPKRQRVASGRSWWGLSADRRALIS